MAAQVKRSYCGKFKISQENKILYFHFFSSVSSTASAAVSIMKRPLHHNTLFFCIFVTWKYALKVWCDLFSLHSCHMLLMFLGPWWRRRDVRHVNRHIVCDSCGLCNHTLLSASRFHIHCNHFWKVQLYWLIWEALPKQCACFFGLIYALNLEYPAVLKNTFDFIQRVILSLGHKSLKPKIQSLKNRLLL